MKVVEASGAMLLAILGSGALGYLVARPILPSLSREEKISWGLAIGFLLQAAILSVLLLFRLSPRPILMILYGIVLALVARRRGESLRPARRRLPRVAAILLCLAAMAWGLFLLTSAVEPMWANDYVAIWGFKAKTIFLSSSAPARLFHDPATSFSHPEYPLLLPLVLGALSALVGSWNDHALALAFPAFSAAILLALFGFFRRRGRTVGGAIAALLASLFFPLFQAFEVGMAEIPLALALLLLLLSSADFVEGSPGAAGRVAVAAFLCCGFKQEGTLFVLLLAAGFGLRSIARRSTRQAAAAALLVVPAALNWSVLRAVRGSLRDRDFDLSFLAPDRIPWLLARMAVVWSEVARSQWLPLAVPAAALAIFLLATPRSRLDPVLLVLAAQVVAYVSVCALSSFDPLWQAAFVPRIAGALFPVLCAVAGDRSGAVFDAGFPRVADPGARG